MKIVVFGLSVSSSWGNGHATLWRGLCRALGHRRHRVVFFERDVPYYARHRDLVDLPGGELVLYTDWGGVLPVARAQLADADVAMVTSFCPDGIAASDLIQGGRALRVFYDLDTPVTLEKIERGEPMSYIPAMGLRDFDLVLSYTGGAALTLLQHRLGAGRVAALYGSVDPSVHHPAPGIEKYRAAVSYLGTYAADRQSALERLFLAPARARTDRVFIIGGSLYPASFPWAANIKYVPHVPPCDHAAFYRSSPITLNVTRGAMAALGYCPSGRLFEAAACGVPVLSDTWEGLERFFSPGSEILVARTTEEALGAYQLSDLEIARIGRAARERALAEHTAERRASELEALLAQTYTARGPGRDPAQTGPAGVQPAEG